MADKYMERNMWLIYLALALAYIEAAGSSLSRSSLQNGVRELVIAGLYFGLALLHCGIAPLHALALQSATA